ncbi:MAG: hypothetical protein IIA81_03705 [Thaumarchaeota archaeon]|nr:hypothetical protein [Nitrososphaerota archaeon]
MNSKVIAGIGVGITIVIVVSILAITSEPEQNVVAPQTLPKNEKIGLVINTPTNEITLQELEKVYEEAASSGIGRSNVYLFWNLVEPEKNEYNFRDVDVLMTFNRKNNLQVTLYFSIINGKTLGPFPNWIGNPPIQNIPADRLINILDVILTRYNIVDTVIIGADVNAYFRYNENKIPIYKELFNKMYDEIKEKHPDVKIANSFSLHDIINKNLEHIVSELNIGDFIAFTYFPVDTLYEISKNPHDEARADLEKMFKLVPDKNIALFEISWSTSNFVGGSEGAQVDFVLQAFDFYNDNEPKIEFFTWYRQYDKLEGTCIVDPAHVEGQVSVGGGSGLGSSEFVIERLSNYICSAGLIDSDGNKKPAWTEFEKVIKQNQ